MASVLTEKAPRRRIHIAAVVAGILGVVLSITLSVLVKHWTNYIADAKFTSDAEDRQADLQSGLDGYMKALVSVQAFFEISGLGIRQDQAWHIAETLRQVHPGVLDYARIPRVTNQERAAFEARLRAEGRPGFEIRERNASGQLVRAAEHAEYFPLLANDMPAGTPAVDGYDFMSDSRWRLFEQARDNGRVVVPATFELMLGGRGIVAWAPVYRLGSLHDTAEARREALVGYAALTVRIRDMLESILTASAENEVHILISEPDAVPQNRIVYWRPWSKATAPAEPPPEAELRRGLYWEGPLNFGGHRWHLLITPVGSASESVERNWQAMAVLVVGLAMTFMIVAYLAVSRRRTVQLENLTTDLRRTTDDLRAESERRLAINQKLERDDAILDAVAGSATDLIEAHDPVRAVPKVLERVGSAAGAGRAYLLGDRHVRDGRVGAWEQHEWRASDLAQDFDRPMLDCLDVQNSGLARWKILLDDGRPISSVVSNLPERERNALRETGLRSIVVMPISVNGQWWGEIGLGDHHSDRVWSAAETGALHTLAEMIGAALTQAQYVKQLADANTIVENSPTILFRLAGEPSLPMMYISHNIVRFGYDPEKFLNTPGLYLSLAHPDDQESLRNAMARVLSKDAQESTVEFRLRTGTGAFRWVENRFTPVRDNAGRLIEIEGVIVDVTERKAAAEKIELLARTDPLTGLANRATFNERLGYAFSAAKRGGPGFAVLYLDLDHFKNINDTLGHPMGDTLLKTVAERLQRSVRETDLVARLGGDEFAVLQMDVSEPSVAGVLAAKIQEVMSAAIMLGDSDLRTTVSMGISLYSREIETSDEMLSQADLALYRSKEEGRNRYSFHSGELDEQVRERVAIAEDLKTAIEKDQLELYYQPQVELASGRIVGMEALVRWNHPTRGLLKPALFVPIAEKTGTILPLGMWVLEHACRQMKEWRDVGLAPPMIAVNLSLAQIKSGEPFIQDVGRTLKKWGLAPSDLEFDVTESLLAQVTWAQDNILERLRELGIRVALDNFGGEYSSLDYVRKYQINHIKIAKPFIDRAVQEPERAATIRAIMGLGRDLGVDVIAEGVETERQRALLISIGSHSEAQGFFFSEPVPADRALDLLRRGALGPLEAASGAPLSKA